MGESEKTASSLVFLSGQGFQLQHYLVQGSDSAFIALLLGGPDDNRHTKAGSQKY